MTEQEYDELERILTDYDEKAEFCDELTDWERNFMADTLDRQKTYRERTRVSDKQWEVLRRIHGKL